MIVPLPALPQAKLAGQFENPGGKRRTGTFGSAARRLRCNDCKRISVPKRDTAEFSVAEPSPITELPAKAPCVALVPVGAFAAPSPPVHHALTRPDPRFVTHLIAMAELSPQTRLLRRAA